MTPAVRSFLTAGRDDAERALAGWRAPGLRRALAVCAVARGAYLLVMWGAVVLRDRPGRFVGLAGGWDGAWYLRIARGGYASGALDTTQEPFLRFAFFPLWPGVLRAGNRLSFAWQIGWGLGVVTVCSLLFTALVWRLVADRFGEHEATWVASLVAVAPGTYVFSFLYAEPLFLVFASAFLLALRGERWLTAGVLAALGGLTRPTGIALVATTAWVVARRAGRPKRVFVTLALAAVGLGAHLLFTWRRTGELTAYLTVQRDGWGTGFDPGRSLVVDRLLRAVASPTYDTNAVVAAVCFVLAVIGLVLLVRLRPPGEWVVYAAVVLALAYLNRNVTSAPRFTYTAFPVVIAIALAVRPRWRLPVLAVTAVGSGVLVYVLVTSLAITP